MQVFDFFTRDEMRAAPAEPEEAFLYLVDLAFKRLAERTEGLSWDQDRDSEILNEARHGFMNVTVGLAKTYRIEPIASMPVPEVNRYGNLDYKQFKADLDHLMVQILGRQVHEEREDSVALAQPTKETLRTYLHHIKVWIDAAEMPDAKRVRLREKLAEFEDALDKNRLPLVKLMRLLMEFSLAGLAIADSQTLRPLIDKMIHAVAEVHAIEGERRQIPQPPSVALLPPRPSEPKRPTGPREAFAADLDDEIPF